MSTEALILKCVQLACLLCCERYSHGAFQSGQQAWSRGSPGPGGSSGFMRRDAVIDSGLMGVNPPALCSLGPSVKSPVYFILAVSGFS